MAIFGGALGGVIGGAVVSMVLDDARYNAQLAEAEGRTAAATGKMGASTSKLGVTAKAGLTAAATAAVAFGVSSVKAFEESQGAMAQTNAVIESTGGVANVTANDVVNLANKIRNLSGIDDEAVQATENLLMTFKDVHNEAGKGNDIFNQTTLAIADMTTAMAQGAIPTQEQLKQTTIQVGKALNDPIQGMTALKRVGVTFNDTQVETIKRLQESGDLMGAQKVILAELKQEFGGAAEAAGDTFAGAMAKASNKVGDFKEKVGGVLATDLLLLTGDLDGAAAAASGLIETAVIGTPKVRDLGSMIKVDASAVGDLTAAQTAARTEMQHLTTEQAALNDTLNASETAAGRAADAAADYADAMRKLNALTRAQWALSNEAAGGLLGLVSADMDATQSQHDLAGAQAKVNRLADQGKKGTKEYAQAVRDRNAAEIQSIQSQQNLEGSAQSLYAEFKKGNVTLAEADDRLRAQAASAGLSAGRTNDLVSKVNALYAADRKIPADVTTNFTAPGLDAQMSALSSYWTKLNSIPTHKDVYIVTHYSTVGTPGTAGGPQ